MALLDAIALAVSMAPGILFMIAMLLAQVHYCHVLQLEGYVNKSYFKWLKANFRKSFVIPLVIFAVVLFLELAGRIRGIANSDTVFLALYGLLIACAVLLIVYAKKIRYKQAKKPLVYTARIKRLLGCLVVLLVVLYLIYDLKLGFDTGLLVLLVPLLAPLANLIMRPAEKGVQKHYFNDAKKKLAVRKDIIKIGITGSYGKTSTKFILGTILSQKFNTLVPPQSYNTPMGLTRVIREQMKAENEVFIAEMGARHVGDIAELCNLVHPKYALLTSVGPQHLETFFTIDNVINTKYELVESLPEDGVAVFNGDNEYVRKLYEKTHIKKILYAMEADADIAADIRVSDVRFTPEGSEFDVVTRNHGSFTCKTQLLGKHNILNILGGIALALELGLSVNEVVQGVALTQPVEHRLQILPTGNGVTVIDDAFNSNPAGAAAAIEVISKFEGRKIVVTPGMVELGEKEDTENYIFGKKMSVVCDIVFLIGPKHTRPIYNGLVDGGFLEENIFVNRTLEEASAQMGVMLRAGDVVLFENDLPDNYNE